MKGFLYSKFIDLFIGVSNYTVKEILRDFGAYSKNKTMTIYNGVFLQDIKIKSERNSCQPIFLVASHLREFKGIPDLIIAVSKLSNEIKSKLKITIYGDEPNKNQLLKKVAGYKLQNIFEFRGSVSNLKELYCNYDYMLQPTHMDCFSLSILESFAANMPVIATNADGNKEALQIILMILFLNREIFVR